MFKMSRGNCVSDESADEESSFTQCYNFDSEDRDPPRERRAECERCSRPATVCWCPFLPKEKIQISTNVFILQHPFEELRKLKTAPMLAESIVEDKCHIIRGKRLGYWKRNIKYPALAEVLTDPNTVLMYPGDDAIDITELPVQADPYNLVVLDGTWSQSKAMYINNVLLKTPRKVMIKCSRKSVYVVRTQPTDQALSTLECVAVALGVLEHRPELFELLTAPLVALCDFQKKYGAVEHQSKEYRISHGIWEKQISRKMMRRLEREKQAKETSEQCTESKLDERTGQDERTRQDAEAVKCVGTEQCMRTAKGAGTGLDERTGMGHKAGEEINIDVKDGEKTVVQKNIQKREDAHCEMAHVGRKVTEKSKSIGMNQADCDEDRLMNGIEQGGCIA